MSRAAPVAVRAYRVALRLLPKRVREQDEEEMVGAFASLWADAAAGGRRVSVLARTFGRIPVVAWLEWRDHLGAGRPAPAAGKRGGGGMDGMWTAAKHGARSLRRSPTFSWSAVLLLGFGVGAVMSIFTIVDHVLLRPLPYPAAERLVLVQNGSHSWPSYEDFQRIGSVDAWSAVMTDHASMTGEGDPIRVSEAWITPGFFGMFAALPAVGRLLAGDDFRTTEGVVISHGTWQRVWGGDPGVVGRTIRLNGEPVVVVGILDASFTPPEAMLRGGVDLYRPIDPASDERLVQRNFHVLSVVGRLRPGATLADVNRDAEVIAEWRAEQFPDQYVDREGQIDALPVVGLQDATVGRVRQGLGLLLGAVTLLLLVACVNVAHLFMARGVGRSREIAVRRALGAGTGILSWQLLVESLLIGAGGAVLGIGLAAAGLRAFTVLSPEALPRGASIAIDLRVLAIAIAVAAATATIFGLLPALRFARRDAADALRSGRRGSTGGRGAQSARGALVVAEVALSLVLVAQAGWLLRSFMRLHEQDLGFRTEGVWTLPMTPTGIETPEEWNRRMEGIRQALAETPGVRAATFGLSMPLEYTGGGRCCWGTGAKFPQNGVEQRAVVHPVDADYFDALGVPPVAGTTWLRSDRTQPPPAVLSEPLAIEAFGSARDALGRTVEFSSLTLRVVGVVPDNRHYGPDQPHGNAVYIPTSAMPFAPGGVTMAVWATDPGPGLPNRLREAVWRVEPELPVPLIRSMGDAASQATARYRFDSVLFSTFGVVALLLVAGGLAGTLLYGIRLRRRELGIRIALGASGSSVERRVLLQGLGLAGVGVVIGTAAAWLSGRFLESRLFGVEARDFGTLGAGIAVLLIVALISSWLPARRAAATDPMETLRVE